MTTYMPAMLAHLAGEATTLCHCWRLTTRGGTVTGFTDHDKPLTILATVCEPEAGFSASEARDTLGLAVDTVDVEGALSSDRIRDEDVYAGLYDGAKVETYLVNWREPEQFALLRTATIGKITRSDRRFVAELESLVHTLDQPSGRYVRRTCDAELGDARCGFLLSSSGFHGSGAVLGSDRPFVLAVSGLAGFASSWFAAGTLTWTSGARGGQSERVLDHIRSGSDVSLSLWPKPGAQAGPGDTFTITAGCDKRFETCKARFHNALNFTGFPHLPGNDAAYGYVTDGGQFDGGPVVP